jgi:hypothetical protein
MLKWIKKLFSRKRKVVVHYYGKYDLKPVVGRALSVVMGLSKDQLANLVKAKKLALNEQLVTDLEVRLESGQYQILFFAKNQAWNFHIE